MNFRETNTQQIYETLKNEIINQYLEPGKRLPEQDLANKFGVSRTPIRQVLQQLALEGFVEFLPNRGAFVKQLSPEELRDVFQIRMALERLAAELFCSSPDSNVMEELRENLVHAKQAVEERNVAEYARSDEEFHHKIVLGCHNKELHHLIEPLNQKTYIFRLRTLETPGQLEKSYEDHKDILIWLSSNNPQEAGNRAANHIKGALDKFNSFLSLKNIYK